MRFDDDDDETRATEEGTSEEENFESDETRRVYRLDVERRRERVWRLSRL